MGRVERLNRLSSEYARLSPTEPEWWCRLTVREALHLDIVRLRFLLAAAK